MASTNSGPLTFGSSSWVSIRHFDSPSASAAATKSRSTTWIAAPRVTRAMRGIVVSATPAMMIHVLGPTVVIATSTISNDGRARRMSTLRIMNSSRRPRFSAAASPMATPSTNPIAVATTAKIRIARPPSRNRDQTSWPSLSVPNSNPSTLAWFGVPTPSVSPCGANSGPSDGDADDQGEQGETDASPPQPRRPDEEAWRATDLVGGDVDREGRAGEVERLAHRSAHVSLVRRRGVTRIVPTSASRLHTT